MRPHCGGGDERPGVRAGPRLPGSVAFPEGHAQRPSRRADEPRGPARRAGAALGPHGRDPSARPADGPEQHRRRHEGMASGALPARRGRRPRHRHRPELQREQVGLRLLLADAQHAGRRRRHRHQRGRRAGGPPQRRGSRRLAQFNGYALLSRFKWASNELDFATEQEILRVNLSRGICCHVGGQIDFDSAGNLYLSTGDDTNPFHSAGYTPIDDRANRNPAFDARRTSGNTNDLRGKILRIRVRMTATTSRRRATCSGPARRRRGPRSTPWACATRSGSR